MHIVVINGPNLNMLGHREPTLYGQTGYQELIKMIREHTQKHHVECDFFQSNHEGALIDFLQQIHNSIDGIIINPGGYSHTSVALLDALLLQNCPIVEVHITDIDHREPFRQKSLTALAARQVIKGHGLQGYLEAIDLLTTFALDE